MKVHLLNKFIWKMFESSIWFEVSIQLKYIIVCNIKISWLILSRDGQVGWRSGITRWALANFWDFS